MNVNNLIKQLQALVEQDAANGELIVAIKPELEWDCCDNAKEIIKGTRINRRINYSWFDEGGDCPNVLLIR